VQLSAGADKKETFERLIREKKLGYFRAHPQPAQHGAGRVSTWSWWREAILGRKGGAEKVSAVPLQSPQHGMQSSFEPQLDTRNAGPHCRSCRKLTGTTHCAGG